MDESSLLDDLRELRILYSMEETKGNFCKIHSAAKAIYNRDDLSREIFEKAFPDVDLGTLVNLSWTAYFPNERAQSEITNFKHKIQLESDIDFKYDDGVMQGASMSYFDEWEGIIDELNLEGAGRKYDGDKVSIRIRRIDDDVFIEIHSTSGYHTVDALERLVKLRGE